MGTGFWYNGTVRHFRACVLPEIRRCGMCGLTITHDHEAIQSRVDGAIASYRNAQSTWLVNASNVRKSEK